MNYQIASVFLVLSLIGSMRAGEIFTPHAFHTQLGSINPDSGVGTDVGSFQQPGTVRLASGAFDVDGQFYSMALLLPDRTSTQLARVDTSSGEATLIGEPTGEWLVPLEVSDLGTMYTVGFHWPGVVGDNTNLFTVNKNDGQVTPVGPTGVTRPMDLAFDSQGTLWLVSGGDDGNHLYTLNEATGEATYKSTIAGVEEATEPGAELMGIMFDEHDTLFGTAYYGDNPDFVSPLFSIDPAIGMATVIGNTGFVNPHGGDYRRSVAILGDFDADGRLTAADVDLLSAEVRLETGDLTFDANGDGMVNLEDHHHWVTDSSYANTLAGDANLDGQVDFPDFLALSAAFGQDGGWTKGDFDGSGTVEFSDFLALSANFSGQASASTAPVPEPSGCLLATLGIFALIGLRRAS